MSINNADNNPNKDNTQLSKGGLDINLVINKNYLNSLGDIYKCGQCQKIILNPVSCGLCGHNFCYNCLNSSNCPFGCKIKKIDKASISIYNVLSCIKFACANIGCTESLEYSEVEKHFKECPYQRIKCENEGCTKILLRKNILEHNRNECEFIKIQCTFCGDEFNKKDIKKHEGNCILLNKKNKEELNKENIIDLEEHLKRLSNDLNEIIKENKKLVDLYNSNNKDENIYPNRFSIRKSIVPGFEEDEFFDILKEQLQAKIKNYYFDFNNNYEKILKEIEDLKLLLNQYVKNKLVKENKSEKQIYKEEIKKYSNDLILKIETELKNLLIQSNEKISNELTEINKLLENKTDNINKSQSNKKDMYSLINTMFTNLTKLLLSTNSNVSSISSDFLNCFNKIYNSYNNKNNASKKNNDNTIENSERKFIKDDKDKINKENINIKNLEQLNENKKNSLNNINSDLTELKNNITQAVNLINEKFVDFSKLINIRNIKIKKEETYPITSTSLNLNKNKTNKKFSPEINDAINNKIKLIDLNDLDNKLTSLENDTTNYFYQIKEKLNSEILSKLNEINMNIEKDMDEKIDLFFSLKHCKECEKVDYFYGFIKCIICSEDFCKQCISLCNKCKNFCCIKCSFCKKCDKNICKNCRVQCISCDQYICLLCASNCIYCKKTICSNCILQKCSLCNKNNFCSKCCKKCKACEKYFCGKCYKDNEFEQCNLCKNNICFNCLKKCKEHNIIICHNCCFECNKCNNIFCNKEMISCQKCEKKFCHKCGEECIKNNHCKLCKTIFCKECFNINNNDFKCFSCNKKPCLICSSKCGNCNNIFCKECSKLCKNCEKVTCIKCSCECICDKYFCLKCISQNEIIYPHECIYFSNNCAITDSKKIISLNHIPNNLNIEAKFSVLMTDISDKSFLLVGITDNNQIEKENDNIKKNIFAVNVNNGNKFSSIKGFESFLDFDEIKKGINFVYIMIKENKLFFKVNESIYKWAYDLDKKSIYWFFVENNIKDSATKFFFVRNIK